MVGYFSLREEKAGRRTASCRLRKRSQWDSQSPDQHQPGRWQCVSLRLSVPVYESLKLLVHPTRYTARSDLSPLQISRSKFLQNPLAANVIVVSNSRIKDQQSVGSGRWHQSQPRTAEKRGMYVQANRLIWYICSSDHVAHGSTTKDRGSAQF